MSDDKTRKTPQDAARVNVHEDYELQYWSRHFGVSQEKLKETVKSVGVSADAVRKALDK